MTEALEAAKRARDQGADVRPMREVLKEARNAFEGGDYLRAMERADRVIELCGSPRPSRTPESQGKFCPTCGARYPSDYNRCPMDAAELKMLR
jgi:hypothetical protein